MTGFSYQPAPLASRRVFEAGPRALICRDAEGQELWRLDWQDVTAAGFVEHQVKGARMRRLDLVAGKGRPHRSIGYTGPPGDPAADPDGVVHLDLMAECLDRLAGLDDGFRVSIGEYGRARLAIFAIGLVSAGGAAVLAGAALASGMPADRMGGAAVPLLLMLGFGAVLVWSNAPWRAVPKAPARIFAQALRRSAHPDTGAE